MAPLGPFEPAPRIAVAVSGGSDSIALCLLADRWARARGGSVFGLTVDHDLRPESGAEAAQVQCWLTARNIAHRTLRWRGARPTARIQEEARAARLALLAGWCRRAGILHLLLGHQRQDQAETVLQRLVRGSGIDGLAAMAPVRLAMEPAGGGVRLLRPLLPVSRDALIATLARWDQPWIDDPTNRDSRHARPRLAAALAQLGAEGLSAERLAKAAARAASDRAALDRLCTELLAGCAHLSPAGFVILDLIVLRRTLPALALRVLSRAVTTVSGAAYPPRLERLERLARRLFGDNVKATTLGGCRVVPQRDGRVVVCREPSAASAGPPACTRQEHAVGRPIRRIPGTFCRRRTLPRPPTREPTAWPRPARWHAGQVCGLRPMASRHRRGPRCPRYSTLTARSPLPTWDSGEHQAETNLAPKRFLRRFGRHVPWRRGFRQRSACCRCRMKTVDETVEETIDRPRSECRVHCSGCACGSHAAPRRHFAAGGVGRRRTRGQSGAERWVASARIWRSGSSLAWSWWRCSRCFRGRHRGRPRPISRSRSSWPRSKQARSRM